jgi:hypothetical protein
MNLSAQHGVNGIGLFLYHRAPNHSMHLYKPRLVLTPPDRFLRRTVIERTLKLGSDPPVEISDVVAAWEDLRTAAEIGTRNETISAIAGLSRLLLGIGSVPGEFINEVGLVEFLLDFLRQPDYALFCDNVLRLLNFVVCAPDVDLAPLADPDFFPLLLHDIRPKLRTPSNVLELCANIVEASPPLSILFIRAGLVPELLDAYDGEGILAQRRICELFGTFVRVIPGDPSLYRSLGLLAIVLFVQVHLDTRPDSAMLALLRQMVRANMVSYGLAISGMAWDAVYAQLKATDEPELRISIHRTLRRVFKPGRFVRESIEDFEWGFVLGSMRAADEAEVTSVCKVARSIIRYIPGLVKTGIDAGLVDELLRIAEEGSFPLKDVAFRDLAFLIELDRALPGMAVPILLKTDYLEQLTNFLDSSSGPLLAVVLKSILFLSFCRTATVREQLLEFFLEDHIIERVEDLGDDLPEEAAPVRTTVLAWAPRQIREWQAALDIPDE